tara:strand:+ start:3517 stop:3777 length:261 start_codon:yes stop_codon:yes gene_type:complete
MPKKRETTARKDTTNLESEVLSSVRNVVSFIKSHVNNKVAEASNKNMIKIEKEELKRLNTLLSSFIDEAFFKSSDEITNTIKNISK